jgi:catechol 2,3-dioxygenase-like lactoylglutathione lyase family enzyme
MPELDLFAGIAVSDIARARQWYERLLGAAPSFLPHATEAVWQVGEHRFVYIVERPDRAGGAVQLLFVSDLDARVSAIAARGIEPAERESYENGVRKITYRDPDGNEFGFGGVRD